MIHPYGGILYRLGGDEFAFLTKDFTIPIDDIFMTIDTELLSFDPHVGMAYGAVHIDSSIVNKTHKVEIQMNLADQMMYQKKTQFYTDTKIPRERTQKHHKK